MTPQKRAAIQFSAGVQALMACSPEQRRAYLAQAAERHGATLDALCDSISPLVAMHREAAASLVMANPSLVGEGVAGMKLLTTAALAAFMKLPPETQFEHLAAHATPAQVAAMTTALAHARDKQETDRG